MTPVATAYDPQESIRKAVLQDRKTIEAFGRLVVESGLHAVPAPVLVGAFLEIARAVQQLDREKTEVWRQAGETFLAGLEARDAASRSRRRTRANSKTDGPEEPANTA